ncbi:MAG: flagellar motor protein MotB [Defluviitaleaceae bacterium]|nr:flagellar motor protein MotB [Defluviitaleaceae bacterium]
MAKQKKPKKVDAGSPAWMATFSDMSCLLMCFFVLLFAMSQVDEDRFREFAEAMAGRNIFLSGALGTIFNQGSGFMPYVAPPTPPTQVIDDDVTEAAETVQAQLAAAVMDTAAQAAAAQAAAVLDTVVDRQEQMQAMADAFQTYMAPYDLAEEIGIRVDALGEYMAITFPDAVLFNTGQATLLPQALELIDYVASALAQHHAQGHRIAIQGHTDNVPINTFQFPDNFYLSAARAIAVMRRLMDYHNFNPANGLLTIDGRGEFTPIDTNDTPEGRANNRRVEILVYARQQDLQVVFD